MDFILKRVIDALIRRAAIDESKLNLFIKKFGENRVTIENLIKVKILSPDRLDEALIAELRIKNFDIAGA